MRFLTFSNQDQMPILGLGTWKSKPGEVYEAVKEALRIGYRHLDCAAFYGNENEIGEAIQACTQEGIVKREELWITSKLWNNAHRPEDVPQSLHQTLSDLKLDYLDLYLMHWPVAIKNEINFPQSGEDFLSLDEVPLLSTWEALEKLRDEGQAKHIGVSNFSIKKLKHFLEHARHIPEMNQIELHPYLQQPEMRQFCQEHQIHLTAYSPLGSNDRPERLKVENEPVVLENPVIKEIANRKGASPAQIAISWAIHRGMAVIPKSVNPTRLKENFESLKVALSEEDMEQISEVDKGRRYITGGSWVISGSPYHPEDLWDGEYLPAY